MMMPRIRERDLFDDFFEFPFVDEKEWNKMDRNLYGRKAANLMRTDIKESDTEYKLSMELPGFAKEDIKISLDDGFLTVSAEKGLAPEEEKNHRFIHRERFAGACSRSFYVDKHLTREDVQAKFRHGVLTLTIPKKEEKPAEQKCITIEG